MSDLPPVTTAAPAAVKTAPAVVRPVPKAPVFELPGAPRPVKPSLSGKMIWLYGEPKIGKTTMASEIGNTWFIATEKGQDFVEARKPTPINNWATFKAFVAWLRASPPATFSDGQTIQWLCIDTVDKLFRFCSDSVCASIGIEDPSELEHGKAWSKLRNEFHREMNTLRSLPYGLICISHETRREFEARGRKQTRTQPNVGASGYDWLLGGSDLIIRAYAQDVPEKVGGKVTGRFINERRMQLHPNSAVVAGGRMSKYLPPTLPLASKALLDVLEQADPTKSQETDGTDLPSTNTAESATSPAPSTEEPHVQ